MLPAIKRRAMAEFSFSCASSLNCQRNEKGPVYPAPFCVYGTEYPLIITET